MNPEGSAQCLHALLHIGKTNPFLSVHTDDLFLPQWSALSLTSHRSVILDRQLVERRVFPQNHGDLIRIGVFCNIRHGFFYRCDKTILYIAWNLRRHIIIDRELIMLLHLTGRLRNRLPQINGLIVQIVHALTDTVHRLI